MSLSSLAGMATALPSVPSQALVTALPSSCSYVASTSIFVCAPVTVTGLTITQSYKLLDASGKPQSAFDPNTTASIHATNSVAGTISAGGNNLTIDETQELTLSGLLTNTHTLDGTMTMKMAGTTTVGSTVTPIASTVMMTITNLAVPRSTSGPTTYPASGTITSDLTATVNNTVSASVHVEITFNGTSKVAVVMTIGGFVQHCTIDLANSAPTCG
jgi:hypothetical protein